MKIPFEELEEAVYSSGDEASFWIDKQTGKVVFIGMETKQFVADGSTIADEAEREATRQVLILLGEIESDEQIDENRFLEIEAPNSNEGWQMRADFIETLKPGEVRDKLTRALRGGKPFQKFKNVLLDFPEIREKWFEFEKGEFRKYIERWAKGENIEIEYEAQ